MMWVFRADCAGLPAVSFRFVPVGWFRVMERDMESRLRRGLRWLVAVPLALSLVVSPVLADPPHGKGKPEKVGKKPKGKKGHGKDDHADLVYAGISFRDARRWADNYHYTGYKPLPPGVAKNLARGKPLPPGIAKKVVPSPMLKHLPRHAGYEWRVVGSDLVLVAIASGVVADVLLNVFQ